MRQAEVNGCARLRRMHAPGGGEWIRQAEVNGYARRRRMDAGRRARAHSGGDGTSASWSMEFGVAGA